LLHISAWPEGIGVGSEAALLSMLGGILGVAIGLKCSWPTEREPRSLSASIDINPEQADYLRRNMHAADEEIARFGRDGHQSLQLFTVDQTTGEVVGYLFDSLRCIATGRGKREGNQEVMEWQWANGHKRTRITERLGDDRMRVTQRAPMPDGSVIEEKGESIRRK
jgi:hypothetical protein